MLRTLIASLLVSAGLTGAATAAPSYKVTGKIPSSDGGWDYASYDPALRRIYLSHADGVLALDIDTGAIKAKLADTPRSHQIVPLPGGKTLLVTVGGDNSARFLDAASGTLLASVPTGKGPDAAMYEPKSGLVVVADHAGGDLRILNPKTRSAVGAITVGGTLEYLAADEKGRVFVAVEDQNMLAIANLKTMAIEARIPLPGCDGPSGLAYAKAAGLLVAACGNGKASLIDPVLAKSIGQVDIGLGPDAVMVDPERNVVFVPCGRSGELDVFDASKAGMLTPLAKVTTERGARLGVVDPKTGKVYLPAAAYNASTGPGKWPTVVPGSFHFIVVTPEG